MFQSENINELVVALSKAQGEISPALKDSTNPHFKSKYADLNSVWNACRQSLSKYGLAVIQTTNQDEKGQINLITTLAHTSGQWVKSSIPLVTHKNDAQGIGSSLTYMRRYSLSAIVGIAPDEDDDGEAAMNRTEKKKCETITTQQAQDLNQIFTDCDPSYVEKVWNQLKKSSIKSLDQIPSPLYERLKSAAMKNREQYINSFYEEKQEVAHA